MFFNEACTDRVLKTVVPDCSVSGMGLLELNNRMIQLFDKICRNMAPIVQMNPDEVYIAIPQCIPESLAEEAKSRAQAAVSAFAASGKTQVEKGGDADLPLDDLLTRLREKYATVIINGTSVVAMGSVLELCEAELLKVAAEYCKGQRRNQIGRNDVRWAIDNNDVVKTIFTD